MDQVDEVSKMYNAGLSQPAIAEELDLAPSEVTRILIQAGWIEKQGRKSSAANLAAEQRAAIVQQYSDGVVSVSQIIATYGITWNALYNILSDAGVPYREIRQQDKLARAARRDRAVEMYKGGARLWEIEQETGIRQPVLHAELHRREIPLRRAVTPPDDEPTNPPQAQGQEQSRPVRKAP
jgi:transposase-like protein